MLAADRSNHKLLEGGLPYTAFSTRELLDYIFWVDCKIVQDQHFELRIIDIWGEGPSGKYNDGVNGSVSEALCQDLCAHKASSTGEDELHVALR